MKIGHRFYKLVTLSTVLSVLLQNCGGAQPGSEPDLSLHSARAFPSVSHFLGGDVAGHLVQSVGKDFPSDAEAIANRSSSPQVIDYKALFGVHDPFTKVVNDRGDGFESVYGVRNLRVVLHGIFYRGGANNLYNKYGKRKNENPLPDLGVENLCKTGFESAIYFYSTNFETAPKSVACKDSEGSNTFGYKQITVLAGDNVNQVLEMIYNRIQTPEKGPIYGHCWNGWHASGFASAIALKQFCKYSDDEAVDYWIRNTDGASRGYEKILAKIRAFEPEEKWQISSETRAQICP
jgi:hypothetical protein